MAAIYGYSVTDPTSQPGPQYDPLATPPPADPYAFTAPTDPYAVGPYASVPPVAPTSPYPTTPVGGYPIPTTAVPAGSSGDLTAYEPPLMTIGDIAVTKNTVQVPHGRYPLRGTTWTVQDATQVTESIPAYAIVLAIIFAFFCLLGLLFLLIKERRYSGFVIVSVAGNGFYHSTQFPAGPTTAMWAHNQVNQARALAATAA